MGAKWLLNHSQINKTVSWSIGWNEKNDNVTRKVYEGLIVIPNWVFNDKSHMDLDNFKIARKAEYVPNHFLQIESFIVGRFLQNSIVMENWHRLQLIIHWGKKKSQGEISKNQIVDTEENGKRPNKICAVPVRMVCLPPSRQN